MRLLEICQKQYFRHQCDLGAIPCRQSPDDPGAGDGGPADGNDVLQLGLEDTVEVLAGANGSQGIGVGERREYTDSVQASEVSARARGSDGGVGGVRHTRSSSQIARAPPCLRSRVVILGIRRYCVKSTRGRRRGQVGRVRVWMWCREFAPGCRRRWDFSAARACKYKVLCSISGTSTWRCPRQS